MGTTSSNPDNGATPLPDNQLSPASIQYLLGDLNQLAPSARRLFALGKQCLTTTINSFPSTLDPQGQQSEQHDVDDLCDPEYQLFTPLKLTQPLFVGQTYVKWKSVRDMQNLYMFCAPVKTIIYIQPIDDFPEFITNFQLKTKKLRLELFEVLQSFCQIYFSGFDAQLMPKISMDSKKWQIKTRHHNVTKEKQYLVSDFYPYLQTILPSNGLCILGIIWSDLYPQDDLNFVLGESSVKYKSAMFCFGQFEPKGFNKDTHKPISEVDGYLVYKLLRVISHETCHLLGLQHCIFFHCAMNESSSVKQALEQPLFLCPICLRKLQKCCGFNIIERYKLMLLLLEDLNDQLPHEHFQISIDWLRKCVEYLSE